MLCIQLAPRNKLKLSAFELLYGKPTPQSQEKGLLSPLEMEQFMYALQRGENVKALTAYGNQVLPAPTDLVLYPFQPGDGVNLKTWKTGSLKVSSLLGGTEPW